MFLLMFVVSLMCHLLIDGLMGKGLENKSVTVTLLAWKVGLSLTETVQEILSVVS